MPVAESSASRAAGQTFWRILGQILIANAIIRTVPKINARASLSCPWVVRPTKKVVRSLWRFLFEVYELMSKDLALCATSVPPVNKCWFVKSSPSFENK